VKPDIGGVVEDGEQVSLNGVRVGRLTQDFKKSRIRNEEKPEI
jgi:hypothetical protein